MRIVGVCGSLQRKSSNASLLRAAAEAAPEGVDIVLFDGLRDLPLFDPDAVLVWNTPIMPDAPGFGAEPRGLLTRLVDTATEAAARRPLAAGGAPRP